MKMTHRSHLLIRLQNILFYVLFLAVLGLLAWLGKSYHKSIDFTRGQHNTLSQATQQLLGRLDTPLELIAYVPDDATIHVALKKLVDKYRLYKKDTTLEIVNPELDPERARRDGIDYSGQILIRLGKKSETVNSVAEQTIVNVLQRLARDKPRLVVFLEGHEERSPLETHSSGMAQLAEVLESKGFRFQPHNLIRTQNIPQDASFVVIASPQKDYLPGEANIIRDYLAQGGNLLWLHEPGSLQGLQDIEQYLGLELQEGTLIDANQDLQQMLGIKHPAVIAVIDYGHSGITENLSAHTLFPFATAISRDPLAGQSGRGLNDDQNGDQTQSAAAEQGGGQQSDWHYEPFLSTLPTSWLESGKIEGNVKFDDDADKPGPLEIGMAMTRTVSIEQQSVAQGDQSAAGDTPASEEDKDEPQADLETTDTDRPREQRVVVVGDSDFMLNSFIGHGSNLELASNIFNWLSADDALISIQAGAVGDARLDMKPWALYTSAILLLLVIPLGLFTFGMLRWVRRRKR